MTLGRRISSGRPFSLVKAGGVKLARGSSELMEDPTEKETVLGVDRESEDDFGASARFTSFRVLAKAVVPCCPTELDGGSVSSIGGKNRVEILWGASFCRAKAAFLGFFFLDVSAFSSSDDDTNDDDGDDPCFVFFMTNSKALNFSLSKCIFSSISVSEDAYNDEFRDILCG